MDLDSGKSRRRLHDHPSTKADEELPADRRGPAADGAQAGRAAEAPERWGPTASPSATTASTSTTARCRAAACTASPPTRLLDEKASDEQVGKAVEDLGDRGFASDGLESDDKGRLYLTDYEHNGILRRDADGSTRRWSTTRGRCGRTRCRWRPTGTCTSPPTSCTARSSSRAARTCGEKPYALFRVKVDAGPVLLRREK